MRIYTLFLIILLFVTQLSVAESDDIIWMIPDFPPVGIAESINKQRGIENAIAKVISNHFPEYHHNEEVANLNRIYEEIKNPTKNVCIAGIIKTPEREKFMQFGRIPSVLLTPVALIVRAGEENKFGAINNLVSFKDVLDNQNLTIGIPRKYTLTKTLSSILSRHIGKPNVYQADTTKIIENIFKMIIYERIDYTVAYPWMEKYISEKMNLTGKLKSLYILEDNSPIMYYPAFTKSKWGLEMSHKVDNILREIRQTHEYRSIVERWLEKEDIAIYRQHYENAFLSIN